MKNRATTSESPEQLLENLRTLVGEAEKVIGDTASTYTEEKLSDLHVRFEAARARVEELYATAREKVVIGAKRTDATIRSHPYESLAIALGVGVLLGAFLRRGKND